MEKLSLPKKGPGVLDQASGGSTVARPTTPGTSSVAPPRGTGAEIQERLRKTLFSTDAKVKEFANQTGHNPDPKRLLQSSTLADLFWQLETSPTEAL